MNICSKQTEQKLDSLGNRKCISMSEITISSSTHCKLCNWLYLSFCYIANQNIVQSNQTNKPSHISLVKTGQSVINSQRNCYFSSSSRAKAIDLNSYWKIIIIQYLFKLITPRDNKNIILISTSKLDHKKQTNNRESLSTMLLVLHV